MTETQDKGLWQKRAPHWLLYPDGGLSEPGKGTWVLGALTSSLPTELISLDVGPPGSLKLANSTQLPLGLWGASRWHLSSSAESEEKDFSSNSKRTWEGFWGDLNLGHLPHTRDPHYSGSHGGLTNWLLSRASKSRKMSMLREVGFSEMAVPADTVVGEVGSDESRISQKKGPLWLWKNVKELARQQGSPLKNVNGVPTSPPGLPGKQDCEVVPLSPYRAEILMIRTPFIMEEVMLPS